MKVLESYINDDMNSATICKVNEDIVVYTDLSAKERKYTSLDEAKRDLKSQGYYIQEN